MKRCAVLLLPLSLCAASAPAQARRRVPARKSAVVIYQRSESGNRPGRKGDRYSDKWAGRGVQVRIDYLVASPMARGHEVTDHATTIIMTKAGSPRVVKAFGNCGR